MSLDTLRDDIGYLKSVADEGGRPFARDGAALVATGAVWGTCSLIAWAHVTGVVPVPREAARATLYVSLPAILLAAFLLRRNLPAVPAGAASRGISGAWTALIWAFVATAFGLLAAAIRLRNPAIGWLAVMPMFAFYGAGWSAAYTILRRRSHALIAGGCFAMTIVTGALAGTHAVWLAHGLGMLLLVALPGWGIMREHWAGQTA